MTDFGNGLKVDLHYPMFYEQVEPNGRLVIDKACHACWYYYMLAHKNHAKVGRGPEDQIIVEDSALEKPRWMHHEYHNIAKAVAMLYQLDSPDDFIKYFPLVQREAARIGYDVPYEIIEPFDVGTGRSMQ